MSKYKFRIKWIVTTCDTRELDFDPFDEDNYKKMDDIYDSLSPENGDSIMDISWMDEDIELVEDVSR
jgi:hypothetical protein